MFKKWSSLGTVIKRGWNKHLLLSNCISSGGLLFLGDFIEQRAIEKRKSVDRDRSLRMLAVGLSQGPPHHYWYLYLDKWLPGKTPLIVGKKILADQIFAAPFFAVTFIVFASYLEGKSLKEGWKEFCNKFPTIYLFDWLIWPPSQAINFIFVPEPFRVLYVNFVTVLWDMFLSYIKHQHVE